ncbi:MAG: flagellar hook-associated protein FlgK [Burkholderiales bacterium]|nr:flagellar hook-associated protein FlgK [Burkholderiales bacterium]
MSSIINIGVTALTANQNALQTISHNIANVNTPGYSRQQVQLQNIAGQYTGSGYFGKGVDVLTVKRVYDDFLTRQAATAQSVAASDSTRYSYMKQLESLFPGGPNGLGASVSDMLNSFSDITNAPTDLTARSVVLARADEMASRFRAMADSINELRIGTTSQLDVDVKAVNNLATQIGQANEKIALALGSGQPPNDMLDQRDQLIRDLNKYVQTTNIVADDGSINIFLAGSQPLVLGKTVAPVGILHQDQYGDPTKAQLTVTTGGVARVLQESTLGGGEMAGLLRFQNTDLTNASNLLGRMALAIGTRMNEQQALGLDLNGNPGNPLFNLATIPSGLPQKTPANAGTATLGISIQGNPSGTTSFLASNYSFTFASATTGTITRLSDGVQTPFDFGAANPVQLDGLNITLGGGAAVAGDKFLLTPFAGAARGINTAFSSPKELAMASPLAASAGTANTGALTLQGLTVRTVPIPPAVTLTFTGPGSYTRSDTGATVYAYVPGQAIEYTVPPATPQTGWSLTLKGIPQPGDTYTVAANPYPLLDGANAKAMLDLRDLAMFDGGPLTDGYASVIAEIGTKVQGAEQSSKVSGDIAVNLEKDRTAVAGVNLDEEAARLIQYQQAYQASGKMMQIAQNIFDTLMASFSR